MHVLKYSCKNFRFEIVVSKTFSRFSNLENENSFSLLSFNSWSLTNEETFKFLFLNYRFHLFLLSCTFSSKNSIFKLTDWNIIYASLHKANGALIYPYFFKFIYIILLTFKSKLPVVISGSMVKIIGAWKTPCEIKLESLEK